MMNLRIRMVVASLVGCAALSPVVAGDAPTIDPGRVADRKAIERVYWNHRTWPTANPGSKPGLAAVLPDSELSARVTDDDRKRAALQHFWSRAVTAGQVQAELDRMAANTKAPKVLAEIFAALDNDPQRIARALAEPALVDRLIRSWYAGDGRFHEAARRRAERALQRSTGANLRAMDGEYSESTFILGRSEAPDPDRPDTTVISLDRDAWDDLAARLRVAFDIDAPHAGVDTLSQQRTSRLIEEQDAFRVQRILEARPDRVRIASVAWPKQSFEQWWSETRAELTPPAPVESKFTLPALPPACAEDTWSPMASESPAGRTAHTAVWTGSEMIIWGGSNAEGPLRSGARYTPATDTWLPTEIDAQTPTARSGSTTVWTGTEMIVWGGSSGSLPETGGRYDPQAHSWRSVRSDATAPAARGGHVAVWTGTRMIVWGGANGSYTSTGGVYDPANDTWLPTRADATAPAGRGRASAVWTGSEMIVCGGEAGALTFLSSGGRYSPATDTWVPISGCPAVAGYTAVWTGSRMVVWGGYWRSSFPPPATTIQVQSGGRYDPATDSWAPTPITPVTPSGRSGHAAIWTGSRMIVWGGSTGNGASYDPSGDTWFPVSPASPAPPSVAGSTAIWTGSEMIVWGGGSNTSIGGRYDPVNDTWVRTAIENEFPGDIVPQGPQAVWTGSEMIVWSGPASGGRYVPATDSWVAMTGVGSPSNRSDAATVWTGTEMIVYGGCCYTGTQAGGAYNPTTNTWTNTNPTGQPDGMQGTSAVWTGTEMIVWGGYANVAFYNTGGRYNPVTRVWTPTRADATAPQARFYHSAVWTGGEMIVWGGRNERLPAPPFTLNTGARYNPASDTWMALPAHASVPEGRYQHAAVWTGSEMIAWGGLDESVARPVRGWAYAPDTNHWRSLRDDATAPVGRRMHAQIWTGWEMIVWGGDGNGTVAGALGTGARYVPVDDTWTPTRADATTPAPRYSPASVYTGDVMLVWGGLRNSGIPNGAAYCPQVCATVYRDADGDGRGDPMQPLEACGVPAGYSPIGGDCSDQDGQSWDIPGETTDLILSFGPNFTTFNWSPPSTPGGTTVMYDLLRSTEAGNFQNASCIVSAWDATTTVDATNPAPGQKFFYLVRAVNGCPDAGILGRASDGTPVVGPACP